MEILGQGHKGIAIADGEKAVKKFYLIKEHGEREQAHLVLLADLQRMGFNIGCVIPELLEAVGEGSWQLAGKTYTYCNRLERIPGTAAHLAIPDLSKQELETLGISLGNVLFAMHTHSKDYEEQWKPALGREDQLLAHILEEKAAQVMRDGFDQEAKAWTREAAAYLENQHEAMSKEQVLSHHDLSLPNILVGVAGQVEGLVDWFGLGPTSASLSLYQLSPSPLWPYVKQQYEERGGTINEDIVYAAATIHLAWAPIICRQLGIPLDEDQTRRQLEAIRLKFHT